MHANTRMNTGDSAVRDSRAAVTLSRLGPSPQLCTIAQVAAMLALSTRAVRRMIDAGTLTPVRLPMGDEQVRVVRVDLRDVERLIERGKA
jgi:excisionase family DNA binding protein